VRGEAGVNELDELRALERGESLPRPAFDPDRDTYFAGVSGVQVEAEAEMLPGLTLRPAFADLFAAPVIAFASPPAPGAPHPSPWVAVEGGFSCKVRTELAMGAAVALEPLSRQEALWMCTAILRLYVPRPIKAVFVANKPIDELGQTWRTSVVRSFEAQQSQIGAYRRDAVAALKPQDVLALGQAVRACLQLWPEERFRTAFTLFDQVSWSVTPSAGTLLLWTAVGTLYAVPRGLNTGDRLADAVASHVTNTRPDRDRWYPRVRDAYRRRGAFVHAGKINSQAEDFIEAVMIARTMLHRVIETGRLP